MPCQYMQPAGNGCNFGFTFLFRGSSIKKARSLERAAKIIKFQGFLLLNDILGIQRSERIVKQHFLENKRDLRLRS